MAEQIEHKAIIKGFVVEAPKEADIPIIEERGLLAEASRNKKLKKLRRR